jgi:hypothetical protein
MWLHCRAIFQSDQSAELSDLGIETTDWKEWTDFSIHTTKIDAFNQASSKDCCTIWFHGDTLTLNIPYSEMIRIMDKQKEGIHFTDEPELNAE